MVFLFFLFFQLVVVLRSQLVITLLFLFLFLFFFWGGGVGGSVYFQLNCRMKNYVTEINRISLRPIRSNYFTKLGNNHQSKCRLWELTYLNPIYNLHYGKSNLVHWFKPSFELCCLSALRTNLLKSYLQFTLWQVKLSSLVQTVVWTLLLVFRFYSVYSLTTCK